MRIENRSVVVNRWGQGRGVDYQRAQGNFLWYGNFLSLDFGGGYTTVYIYQNSCNHTS